ncbi:MAG: hypothetical protein QGG36_04620 [Pirellulaceae bacterium]|jgi:hypothetical protein|nr:hypothetical protein [Pirellulaceae bacterium]MDP7015055.1 hypothetical protein [Pirellulaceae bacterium]
MVASVESAALWAADTLLSRLEGPVRVKVLAAFVAMVILGIGLMLLTFLGARVTRRYMAIGEDRRRLRPPADDDWLIAAREARQTAEQDAAEGDDP